MATFPPKPRSSRGNKAHLLSVERRFWERATILHEEFHRPESKSSPVRLSRHFGDFYGLIRKKVAEGTASQLELLERVAQHKSLFFKSSLAKYGETAKGTLRVAPPRHTAWRRCSSITRTCGKCFSANRLSSRTPSRPPRRVRTLHVG